MSYTLNKTGVQIDAILNRAAAGGQIDLDIAAEAAARAAADALKAPLASPALTGTPTAPTAAPGTDTTQLATTAFANAAAAAAAASAASGKADKVAGATAGNLAGLDGSGNLTDAGIAAADVATKDDVQNITPKRTSSNDPANSSFSVLCDTALAGQAKPKLYGKSAVINQFIGQETPTSMNGLTVTYANGKLTVTGTANANTNLKLADNSYLPTGHTVALLGSPTGAAQGAYGFYFSTSGDWVIGDTIRTYSSGLGSFNLRVVSGQTVNIACYPMFIDLTAIFTSAELTAIGTSVANLKTAWLKKFGYPLPQYIPYDAGSIVSNNSTYQLRGASLVPDSAWSRYSNSQVMVSLKLKAGESYYCASPVAGNVYYMGYFDGVSKNFSVPANGTFTVPADCNGGTYITGNYGTGTFRGDISFTPASVQHYEPYYNGGSVTADDLNGFDGTSVQDTQDADGQEVRKVGTLDLGDLNWQYRSNFGIFTAPVSNEKENGEIICPAYTHGQPTTTDMCIRLGAGGYFLGAVCLSDSRYTDAATLKAALAGVPAYYELATPTTSTTTPSDLSTQAGYNSLDPVAGDVQSADASVEYPVDVIAYIDKKLAEL